MWPSWGVVAAAALTVLVLAPLTCFSMCIDRRAAALLGWVTFSLAGVACSMQVSVGHLSTLLDHGTCVGAELQSTACRGELAYVFVPWIAFFTLFALGTAALVWQALQSTHLPPEPEVAALVSYFPTPPLPPS